MTRKPLMWYGVLGAMLLMVFWRLAFSIFPFHTTIWSPIFLPVVLAVAGCGLFLYGWRSGISGRLPQAGALLGLSAALLVRLGNATHPGWLPSLGLVPLLAGVGMLIEIQRGQGWQFSRRQGIGLMMYGGFIAMAFVTLANPGGPSFSHLVQLNLLTGWSVFIATVTEIWVLFGSFLRG